MEIEKGLKKCDTAFFLESQKIQENSNKVP